MNKLFGFENSGNRRDASKPFGFSISFGRSKQPREEAPKKMTLSQIKLSVELCINSSPSKLANKWRHSRSTA